MIPLQPQELSKPQKKQLADTRKSILEYVYNLNSVNDKTKEEYIRELK